MRANAALLRLARQRRLKTEIEHQARTRASDNSSTAGGHAAVVVAESGIAVVDGSAAGIELDALGSSLRSVVNERIEFGGVVGSKNCACRSWIGFGIGLCLIFAHWLRKRLGRRSCC